MVSIYDIVVGDVMHLEAGDVIPVDGIVINGYNISCDESDATGESNAVKKVSADVALSNTPLGIKFAEKFDPFIFSGSKVLEGVGNFVVTAVGPNSFHGRTLLSKTSFFCELTSQPFDCWSQKIRLFKLNSNEWLLSLSKQVA